MTTPDRNRSRSYPHTLKATQWAALVALAKRGLELSGDGEIEAITLREILPELEKMVKVLPELEVRGCGLDHPDWKAS